MANLWRRYFARSDHLSESIERAIEEQVAWEKGHMVPYAVDQRADALRQRAERHFGATLPAEGLVKIRAVAAEWTAATAAALETP